MLYRWTTPPTGVPPQLSTSVALDGYSRGTRYIARLASAVLKHVDRSHVGRLPFVGQCPQLASALQQIEASAPSTRGLATVT